MKNPPIDARAWRQFLAVAEGLHFGRAAEQLGMTQPPLTIAIQQLEGNVFYPLVMGRQLRLHPVAILLALTAGGVLAGVAGAFLAIPIAAVTSAVLDFTREHRREQESEAILAP